MRRRAIAGMEDDFDDFDFDSESEEEKQDDGKRPVHDLAQIISDEASVINILDLVIKQLQQAVLKALMPPEPRDEVGIRIFRALRCRSWQTSVLARVKALQNLMTDSLRKVAYICNVAAWWQPADPAEVEDFTYMV